MYNFTNSWFADSELKRLLPQLLSPNAENRILEIGSYEGQSTVFIADTYCSANPASSITTVDPFDTRDTSTTVTNDTEAIFKKNIQASPANAAIRTYRMYSDEFFKQNMNTYTFIYIDGSHDPQQIQKDALNAFKVLENGGILWFDDYRGGPPGDRSISDAIDAWVQLMGSRVHVIFKGYQLGCAKKF